MANRLPNILVIGSAKELSDKARSRAELVGRKVAELGANLITGGRGGVMEAASRAFSDEPFRTGVAIGILPGRIAGLTDSGLSADASFFDGRQVNDWVEIAICTHLPGDNPRAPNSRNYINVLTADLVFAVAGGEGTQAELEIALKLGKPVIAFLDKEESIGIHPLNNLPTGIAQVRTEDELSTRSRAILEKFLVARPNFGDLKKNYNTDSSSVHQCSMTFPNTCAIRMGEALVKTDATFLERFKASSSNKCPHGYIRGAQDLASLLRRGDVFGTQTFGFSKPGSAPGELTGRKGIVCYMNIPTYPDGQGHIDLWEDDGPVGSAYWNADPIWFWHLP